MSNNYFNTAQTFKKTLNSLITLLKKTQEYSQTNNISESELLDKSIIEGMHPLSKQIQISCDGVKGFVCRLTGSEIPENADTEKSIDELITRIESVISIVNSCQESDYQKANEVNIVLPWMKHAMPGKFLTADVYLNQFAIPNIYFHLVTAYNIMRMAGVPIGKFDYIGGLELSE